MSLITSDFRQFSIADLFQLMLSLAIPLGIATYSPVIGGVLLAIVCSFWFGYGLLLVSDLIDNRAIDERGCLSQLFNLTGVIVVALSIIAASTAVLVAILFVLAWLVGDIPSSIEV